MWFAAGTVKECCFECETASKVCCCYCCLLGATALAQSSLALICTSERQLANQSNQLLKSYAEGAQPQHYSRNCCYHPLLLLLTPLLLE